MQQEESMSMVDGNQHHKPYSSLERSDIAIEADHLVKTYNIYNHPTHRFFEAFHPMRKKYHYDFYALKDVSFRVKKGETVGIIGKNGSGKSTLLKIITGVLTPTSGVVKVRGNVSALLELGAGFNPELTGIENVYFNGSIMGFKNNEIDAKIDDILSFADIGKFVYQPVKTYSSGMFVRLAFSVVTMMEPEILIVDEALSVGDMFFQTKCMMKIKRMIEHDGITLLFVSHDINAVKALCKNAILLQGGVVMQQGDSFSVAERYLSQNFNGTAYPGNSVVPSTTVNEPRKNNRDDLSDSNKEKFDELSNFQRIGNKKVQFHNVQLFDQNDQVVVYTDYNQKVTLKMFVKCYDDLANLAFSYHIVNKNGINVVYNDSYIEKNQLYYLKKGRKYILSWTFDLALEAGDYTVIVAASEVFNLLPPSVEYCDYIPIACQFNVGLRYPSPVYGAVYLKNDFEFENDT